MIELILSGGGPLILVRDGLLPSWGGIENIGGLQSQERNCFEAGRPCDYDRACAVEGWIGEVSISDGSAVVFSGDQLSLGIRQVGPSSLLVVRPWCHEENLDEQVSALLASSPPFEADFEFAVMHRPLTVFDSANPGFEIFPPLLRTSLEPGRYVVSTYAHRWDGPSGITLHRLERQH